VFLIFKSRDTL